MRLEFWIFKDLIASNGMFSSEGEDVFGGWLEEEDTNREQWVRIGYGESTEILASSSVHSLFKEQ